MMTSRAWISALLLSGISGVSLLTGCQNESRGTPPVSSAMVTGANSKTVAATGVGTNPGNAGKGTPLVAQPGNELAIFAEGCFWGSENTFRHVPGVVATAVGYTGGTTQAPTYEAVCSHRTAHAEAVLIEFDPKIVSYKKLVGVFFRSHDPTTENRQGPDVGDQYRSAVFTVSPAQAEIARAEAASAEKTLGKKVTTQIATPGRFWKAEDYHQQYDEKTGTESCPLPSILGN